MFLLIIFHVQVRFWVFKATFEIVQLIQIYTDNLKFGYILMSICLHAYLYHCADRRLCIVTSLLR